MIFQNSSEKSYQVEKTSKLVVFEFSKTILSAITHNTDLINSVLEAKCD